MSNKDDLEFVSVGNGDVSTAGGATWTPNDMGGGAVGAGGGGGAGGGMGFIRSARHPVAAFFHVLFKFLALFMYAFCGWFGLGDSFIFVTIICILLLAADFWTVKNVTGRLLVGLRWWNMIKSDGTSEWIYESLDNMSEVDKGDARVFWWSLYATPVLWIALFIISLLRFNLEWLIIVVVALALNIANIIGYTRCSREAQKRVSSFMQDGAMAGVSAAFSNSAVTGFLVNALGAGGGSSNGNDAQAQQGTAFV